MTNSAELKPCQCGMGNPKDDLIYFNYGGGYEDCDNERYAISCDLCGACGPWAESEADAAARWNGRMGEIEQLRAENAEWARKYDQMHDLRFAEARRADRLSAENAKLKAAHDKRLFEVRDLMEKIRRLKKENDALDESCMELGG